MMGCGSRFAEAWQFASFWCVEQLLSGAHDGAGPGDATLTDATQQFRTKGVEANKGFVLYNLTDDTSGAVTAVTETSLTATGVTWGNGDLYRITLINGIEIANIEHWLDVAASDVHAAMMATDACDCTLRTGARNYLSKLNIIDAAAYFSCKCANTYITDAQKSNLLRWMGEQLQMIATNVIELCQGATGANYPAMGWASQSVTDFAAADIIINDIMRNG